MGKCAVCDSKAIKLLKGFELCEVHHKWACKVLTEIRTADDPRELTVDELVQDVPIVKVV